MQTLRRSSNAKIFRRRPVGHKLNPEKELDEQATALKSLEAEVASISLKLQSQPASRSGGGYPMSLQSPVPVRGLPLVDLFPVPAEIVMPPAAARLDSPVGSTPSQADVVLACLADCRSSIPASHATPKHRVYSAQNIAYERAVLRSVAHKDAHDRGRSASLRAVTQAQGMAVALRRPASRQPFVHEAIEQTL